MKALQLILPAAVIASAALFFDASNLKAFTLDGNSLNLSLRHFRVFNNFTDPTANDNNVPNSNYPGALGAIQAIWKGAGEWSSQPVGNGTGDPTQVVLGSGGANFDAFFAGEATSAGVMGNNIMSELAGSNGGVLAFTELPGSPGGWRILYYSTWEWCDGPGFITGGNTSFDMQGITCHEYGHALGMGHSPDPTATMFASVAPLDTSIRSIEADDISGIQSIYGVKSASKLTATSFTGSGNPLRITGTNFAATNNEVWFTAKNPTAAGSSIPVKVSFLASPTGTTIDLNVPATAGIGTIIVRDGNSSAYTAASNQLPYDPAICPKPNPYCTGKLNSAGFTPSITFSGSNSLSIGGGLTVQCSDGVPGKPGLFLYSDNGAASHPFFGGTLCLAAPIVRSPPFHFDAFGYADWPVVFSAFDVGSYRYFQAWYRDPLSPDGIPVGLSNASELKFCP